MLWNKYDVAFIDSTPPIQGLKLPIVRLFRQSPVVLNLQDIFPDSLAGTNLAKRDGLLWKIGRVVENITYRNADKIIVISDDFKKNIMEKGVPEEKIVVVYNWVDENAVVPVPKDANPLYDELGINREKFSVVYAGNFGHAQNIDVTIAAAERLKDVEDIQFLMFGTGGLVDDYKKIVKEKGLNNMFFFSLQPVEKVSQVYSLGDLGVVACKKGLGKGAFPSKTWSIMSAGTPVIANYDEDTDLERLVKDNALGVFSAADDSEQMAERIMEMYNNRELCDEYGRNARQYILDNVSKEKSTQKYVDVIKEVVEKNKKMKSKK
jgi:glycosyltransferase involved in cell wall biosynthesis